MLYLHNMILLLQLLGGQLTCYLHVMQKESGERPRSLVKVSAPSKRLRRAEGHSLTLVFSRKSLMCFFLCAYFITVILMLHCHVTAFSLLFLPSELDAGRKQISLVHRVLPSFGKSSLTISAYARCLLWALRACCVSPITALAPLSLPPRLAHSGLPLSDHLSVSTVA